MAATATRRKTSSNGGAALRDFAATTLSVEAILELVEKLGVRDLIIDRLRARLENVDFDDFLDDATDYLRRNPELIVVLLGAITVTAGVIVFLDARREHPEVFENEERVTNMATRIATRGGAARSVAGRGSAKRA